MAAMDLLGRRWALRILWELRAGPTGAGLRAPEIRLTDDGEARGFECGFRHGHQWFERIPRPYEFRDRRKYWNQQFRHRYCNQQFRAEPDDERDRR